MIEQEKKFPGESEIPKDHEWADDVSENKEEAKHHIESETHNAMNALKESLAKKDSDRIFDTPDWLGGNGEKHSQKELQAKKTESPFGNQVETDHVIYFSGKNPDRLLGKHLLKDVADIGIGSVDSVATTAKLGGHLVVDTLKFVRHPVSEFKRTQDILNNVG